MNAIQHLNDVFRQQSSITCLIDSIDGRHFTYATVYNMAHYMGKRLIDNGACSGNRIAILCNNRVEYPILYLMCLIYRFVAVPINPAQSDPTIIALVELSNPDFLICENATLSLKDLFPPKIPFWSIDNLIMDDMYDVNTKSFDTDYTVPLSITFTSGTTGMPKGVVHTVGSLLGNAFAFNEFVGLNETCVFYHVLPMSYMAGFLNMILSPLMSGGILVITNGFSPLMALNFWQPIIDYNVNTLWLVPTMLATVLKIDRHPFARNYTSDNLKYLFVGTAPLPPTLRLDFETRYGVTVMESFGLSETLITTVQHPIHAPLAGSVGQPLRGIRLQFGSDDELYICGDYHMQGYLDRDTHQPDYTTISPCYETGDLARLDETGNLFITGRKKDLIIHGGVNISPSWIEDVLGRYDGVVAMAVVGSPHDVYGETVAVVYELAPGYTTEQVESDLRIIANEQLESYARPTLYRHIHELPRSSTGKIKKGDIKEWLRAHT